VSIWCKEFINSFQIHYARAWEDALTTKRKERFSAITELVGSMATVRYFQHILLFIDVLLTDFSRYFVMVFYPGTNKCFLTPTSSAITPVKEQFIIRHKTIHKINESNAIATRMSG
jgi:hypothetical protein